MPPKKSQEYTPPVGPGSKSLAPVGDWRDIDPALIEHTRRPINDETARGVGRAATYED